MDNVPPAKLQAEITAIKLQTNELHASIDTANKEMRDNKDNIVRVYKVRNSRGVFFFRLIYFSTLGNCKAKTRTFGGYAGAVTKGAQGIGGIT